MLANYHFDQDDGNVITESSINGFHGTSYKGVKWNEQGKVNGSIAFNGTDGYVELPGIITNTEDFTFASWVKWNGGADWQRIFDFGNGMSRHMFLTPSQITGALQFTIHGDGKDHSLISDESLPINKWVHVAVTINDTTGKLYVNGELVAENNDIAINPYELRSNETYLGKSRFEADPYFNGSLDEVEIYNYALTETQIQALIQ